MHSDLAQQSDFHKIQVIRQQDETLRLLVFLLQHVGWPNKRRLEIAVW